MSSKQLTMEERAGWDLFFHSVGPQAIIETLNELERRASTAESSLRQAREEIERLNKWADGFSDAQLKERATGEEYQRELRARADRYERALREIVYFDADIDPQTGERIAPGEYARTALRALNPEQDKRP